MTHKTEPRQTAIPTQIPLLLMAVGALVVVYVFLTQPGFSSVFGWAGIGLILIGLFAWVLLAPEQAKAALTGRTVRYGGTSFVVTVVFLMALAAVYTLVKGLDVRVDLTERDEFSLTEASQKAIEGLGVDPNTPQIRILAFYGNTQAGRRDQDSVLFEDYARTSQGKISYEFVDPDRNPVLAEQYGVERAGQLVVVPLDEAGEPLVEEAERVNFLTQEELTNAILNVAASGDFRAYFLAAEGGLELDSNLTILRDDFRDRFGWTVEAISFFDLISPESEIDLDDPTIDGQVLILTGGNEPLTEEQLAFLTDYLDGGGNLILFASPSVQDNRSLATGDALSDYLYEAFGLRFRNDVVLDRTQAVQSPLIPVATDFDRSHYITSTFANGQSGLIFEAPHSIEVAPEPPPNVTVTEIARSSPASYSKTDISAVLEGDIAQAETDPTGPFVLAAAAENTETGARVVLFGSASIAADSYALGIGIANLDAAFNSMVWVTHFNDFFRQVTVPVTQRPQDVPIFASTDTLNTVNVLTVFVIPFGILGLGALVWWTNRERNHA